MSLAGDSREEGLVYDLVQAISRKIELHRDNAETVRVLKELGRTALEKLPNVPRWAGPFIKKFGQ